jgi:HK97 family phage prohead protease
MKPMSLTRSTATVDTPQTGRPDEQRINRVRMEFRTDTTTGQSGRLDWLEGIAVPYARAADIGWFVEEFAPGSLAKSIKEAARSLPLHLFHDAEAFPIGVASKWTDTTDNLTGLWKLDAGDVAQRAAQLATPDENGHAALGYMSIRFAPIRSEWNYVDDFNPDLGPEHKDHVVRTEARLLETSLVSTPAYKEAAVSFVRTGERAIGRAATGREIAGWREYLESVKR